MINKNLVLTALGQKKADLVIREGKLVNVITEEIYSADVAISGSKIAYVGDVSHCVGKETKIIDAKDKYVVPGLIDPHIHPEVCKIPITRFAEAAIPRGTTSIFASLDDMMGLDGTKGARFFLDEAKNTPLKVFYTPYARIPVTPGTGDSPPSTVPHKFGFEELKEVSKWPEMVGNLDTVIDWVLSFDEDIIKCMDHLTTNRMLVHGHDPFESGPRMQAFLTTGIRSDHVPFSSLEALEKLRSGMWVMFCESPIAHVLQDDLRLILDNKISVRHASFCIDDMDTQDLLGPGHIDLAIRTAIGAGLDPIRAVQMATLNAAEVQRMDHLIGSITPGRFADVLIVDDLRKFKIDKVFANGELVASDGKMVKKLKTPKYPEIFLKSFHMKKAVKPADLVLMTDKKAKKAKVLVMNIPPYAPMRYRKEAILEVEDGVIKPDVENDVLYCAVVERHLKTGNVGLGFISGFNLKGGTIASSLCVPHNNIVCLGSNAEDMAFAVNHVAEVGGAQVAAKDKEVVEEIRLPLGGIMADVPPEEMAKKEKAINEAIHNFGCPIERPFFYLMFLDIAGLPDYALGDQGVLEFKTLKYINPILEIMK